MLGCGSTKTSRSNLQKLSSTLLHESLSSTVRRSILLGGIHSVGRLQKSDQCSAAFCDASNHLIIYPDSFHILHLLITIMYVISQSLITVAYIYNEVVVI